MTKELAESRVSLLLFGLSLVSLATAVVATAVAESGVLVPSYLVVVSGLAGPMLLLATMIAYARHIAAQTLGHVAVATVRLADQTLAPAKRIAKVEPNDKAAEDSSEESSESSPAIRRAPVEWTDGSDADDEQADESRKLSKAERKKQRRAQQQQQRRAA
jgi:signal transduction histidine kinase